MIFNAVMNGFEASKNHKRIDIPLQKYMANINAYPLHGKWILKENQLEKTE